MSSDAVHADPVTVSQRLSELSLSEPALREAILQAHLHRSRLTPNHPRIFPGLEMWGWAVASLGEQLRPLGWIRIDVGNFPLTVCEDLGIAIAIAAGDEGTGVPSAVPSNRSKKGRNTIDAVEANQQFDLFDEFIPRPKQDSDEHETWVLLHYTDPVKKEVRIELSRPSEIGEDGKICAWSERIVLTPLQFDGDALEIIPPSGPEIQIDVRRKA